MPAAKGISNFKNGALFKNIFTASFKGVWRVWCFDKFTHIKENHRKIFSVANKIFAGFYFFPIL
ncbi:MAG: hypothetical protein BGN92_06505 [Sphingobacteriales bacterium 41-5]|nr:MAG: hypothetical protein BGN92_06505 [Sphingobacteriales bacterium 41-5]